MIEGHMARPAAKYSRKLERDPGDWTPEQLRQRSVEELLALEQSTATRITFKEMAGAARAHRLSRRRVPKVVDLAQAGRLSRLSVDDLQALRQRISSVLQEKQVDLLASRVRRNIRDVWREELLSSSEAARWLGSDADNPRELARRLRERSALLGIPGRRGYGYPAFQIDQDRRRIHPEVEAVNRLLNAAGDPWGVASWWISRSGQLGVRPVDLVGTPRAGDLVLAVEGLLAPIG
jgi:hypothetical protein